MIEYLECKFNGVTQEADEDVRLDMQVISRRENFKYLGSIIQNDGEIDEDVTHRIRVGWMKCNKNVPLRLKGKFYKVVVRPTMLYGEECWPVKNSHIQQMKVAKMRMLRWMCGHTRLDKIENEFIGDKVRVAPMEKKMREARLSSASSILFSRKSIRNSLSVLPEGKGKAAYLTIMLLLMFLVTAFYGLFFAAFLLLCCDYAFPESRVNWQ
ncbi:uncharacterized protein [Nicotiana sylvestris]|uniref:uncharacterized protein n=1 Tax=Nicotiana sylvestris TaxID=4096 RepID=UPI00388CC593